MTAALTLYRAATGLLEPLAPALLSARARRGKEDPRRMAERLGRATAPRPPGRLAWLHGASVGEGLSLLPLVDALRAADPSLSVLVTSGTVTSAEVLGAHLPAAAVHQFAPIDAPGVAARFLDHWRPDLAVFAESEVWPNLLTGLRARGVPTALVSARLSQASLAGWARVPASARALFGGFARVMAQDEPTAAALAALGAPDDGPLNLKLAAPPLPVDEPALAAARAAAAERPVLLAASTHEGEDDAVLAAYAALAGRPERPLLVVVPRHPERGPMIAALARHRNLAVRRSGAGEGFDGVAAVHVADRLGELGLWFRVAGAALVAGSLVPGIGGHNPLEPARLGTPILSGRFVANWRAVYADLDAVDAYLRVEADTLAAGFAAVLDDPQAAQARAERAHHVAAGGEAALEAAARMLVGLIA